MPCTLDYERDLHEQGFCRVAGIDEAGRGPLAGPLLVAGVVFPESLLSSNERTRRGAGALFSNHGFAAQLAGLDDSKKLSSSKREALYEALKSSRLVESLTVRIEPQEIDVLNILGATRHGMREVARRLRADHSLVDGWAVPEFPGPQTALVGGDGLSLSIAAASVVAKVERDRIMFEMANIYPEYAFERHKGYPTALHLERLKKYGPCPIHRRSFGPVAQIPLL